MAAQIPRARAAGELTWWLNAVLAQRVPLDDATERLGRAAVALPGQPPAGWPVAIAALRAQGVTGLRVRFVVPGDPLGLPGPAAVTQAAVASGIALVGADGRVALVPLPEADRWRWLPAAEQPAGAEPLGTVAECRSLLRTAMAELTAALPALDPDDTALAAIARLRELREPVPPPGTVTPAGGQLAGNALRVWWMADIAAELAERRGRPAPAGLGDLRRLARRAASVAFSEPPAPGTGRARPVG